MEGFSQYKNKGVLVTGGASGLGLAFAESFVGAGARVFIADIIEDHVDAAVTRLSGFGAVCRGAKCDVTEADDIKGVLDTAWAEIGPIDLLCSNAGVVRTGSILDVSQADIDWQFSVNVWGMLNITKEYVKRLRQSKLPGHILFTGSEHSLTNPSYTQEFFTQIYNMSKHAVLAMAAVLRDELKNEKVGVSVLCPGAIATNMVQSSAMSRPAKFGVPTSVEYPTVSEEVADLVAARTKAPEEIAAIAVEGLNKQLFFIPTHKHTREDIDARYKELQNSFELLSL